MDDSNIAALSVAIIALSIYHICTYFIIWFQNFHADSLSLFLWLEKNDSLSMQPAQVICAVQTLRNTMYISIFFGGNAAQFAFYYINGISNDSTMQARSLILAAIFFSSFLSFACVIRNANHLAYMIGAYEFRMKELEHMYRKIEEATQTRNDLESQEDINRKSIDRDPISFAGTPDSTSLSLDIRVFEEAQEIMLSSIALSYTFGFRFLFVSIPFLFYSAGYLALLFGTAVLILVLYQIDSNEDIHISGLSLLQKKAKARSGN